MILRILLTTFLFAATPALAQVYEGAAGSAPIVMQLTEDQGEITGNYFYRSTRLDIALSGKWEGAMLAVSSSVTGDQLSLIRSGTGLVGSVTTSGGRKLAVNLHPAIAPSDLPADLPAGLDLYERLRLAGLKLVPQEAESQNGKTIRWWREPLTGIRLFRLESGYVSPAMAAMNHALGQNQWSAVSNWLQCTGSDGRPGTDNAEADKPWLGPAYVSYIWRSAWSCAGAAHPDFGAEGHSFDALTGRELKLDEVLPQGQAPIPGEGSDVWLNYRSNVFAPAIVSLMKRYHTAEVAPPKKEDDCDYSDPEVWAFPSWVMTEKGLWLGAVFARAMRVCDSPEWSVIPWSALPSATAGGR